MTPGEKHIGIATIRANGWILRYKALPSDQGGYWYTCGSTKVGVVAGKDKYENWHEPDSTFEKDMIQDFLKQMCDPIIAKHQGSVHSPQAVFAAQPQMPPSNYQGYNSAPPMPPVDPNDPWSQPNF